jgi:serine/threonine protein kinase
LNYDDKNKKISKSCKDLIQKLLNMNPQKRLKIKDILEHPFIKKYAKKFSTSKKVQMIDDDKIQNMLNKNLHDMNNNNSSKKIIDNLNNKTLKRCNTLNTKFLKGSNFGVNFVSSKQLLFKDIKQSENSKKNNINENHKSSKKLVLLEKFRYSLNVQLEKAKKSIENISFKNTQNFTFEDIRDSQIQNESNDYFKRYKKYKSSKYNNYYNFNNLKNEENKIKNSNEEKKSISNKNIIFENNYEDFVEGPEEIEALKRLDKVYAKYEKQNLGMINEIQ